MSESQQHVRGSWPVDGRLLGVLACGALIAVGGCTSTPPGAGTGTGTPDGSTVTPDGGDAGSDVVVACEDSDGDGFGPGCAAGADCQPGDALAYPGAAERCGDAVDNNCDGQIDEGCGCADGAVEACYEGPAGTAEVGICRSGFRTCNDSVWSECESQRLPSGGEEVACDGVDEDCDGQVDEGLLNACGQCGAVQVEVCGDGLDNNCDGVIDEASAGCDCDDRQNQPCYPGPPSTLGVGLCRGSFANCVEGAWTECEGAIVPGEETCDGLDNDCDGLVDEGVRNACGECSPVTPIEVCDGVDNDCDGGIDEGVRLACGLCAADGTEEICGNGFDDDCDGQVDESCSCLLGDEACYPGAAEVAGIGACVLGARICDASGEFWGPCTGFVLPSPEVCDGIDNDCDGLVDLNPRGCSVCETSDEVCDGVDNDCDGTIDEALRNPCGECYADVVPEELGGLSLCDGLDNDCDGLVDEGLLNACGACDDSCYVRRWDDPEDWNAGTLEGIDEDALDTGLRLGRTRFTFPDLWIANSSANTVTRIDTNTASAVGTFNVGVSPSRTAVDFNGDVWVANRAFDRQGTLTKIRSRDCVGDACIQFSVNIGGVNSVPRGLAIDREGYAWVGTYNDGFIRRVHPDTGAIVAEFNTGLNIYGLAIDTEGIIWIATISGQGIGAFDTNTNRMLGNWAVPGCSAPYGIAVDGDGNVWFGNWTCGNLVRVNRAAFDAGTVTFDSYSNGALSHTRGVAVDGEGAVYVTASQTDRLAKWSPATGNFVWTVATCDNPIGVGIASDGNIWVVCQGDNRAQRFTPDGTLLGTVTTGAGPYSYSDMTGFQLRNFTAPRGVWRATFECGYPVCGFDEVVFSALTPEGTAVSVRARSTADGATFSEWTPLATSSPADLRSLPDGRAVELEFLLTTTRNEVTPVITDVEVYWQRP
jgi:streptogramin lyase